MHTYAPTPPSYRKFMGRPLPPLPDERELPSLPPRPGSSRSHSRSASHPSYKPRPASYHPSTSSALYSPSSSTHSLSSLSSSSPVSSPSSSRTCSPYSSPRPVSPLSPLSHPLPGVSARSPLYPPRSYARRTSVNIDLELSLPSLIPISTRYSLPPSGRRRHHRRVSRPPSSLSLDRPLETLPESDVIETSQRAAQLLRHTRGLDQMLDHAEESAAERAGYVQAMMEAVDMRAQRRQQVLERARAALG